MLTTTLQLIRQTRIKKNYSQEVVATKLYFTQSYYAKVECGKAKLSAELLFRILEVLELDCGDFFTKVEKIKLKRNK